MLEKVKAMVDILVKNSKSISATDEKAITDLSGQIDSLKNQITASEKEVGDIQTQYKAIEKEFFGLARLSISK
jgi:predicted  nucleic acid-binding Zn-ribbon protein